jgi:hypothetical protein
MVSLMLAQLAEERETAPPFEKTPETTLLFTILSCISNKELSLASTAPPDILAELKERLDLRKKALDCFKEATPPWNPAVLLVILQFSNETFECVCTSATPPLFIALLFRN